MVRLNSQHCEYRNKIASTKFGVAPAGRPAFVHTGLTRYLLPNKMSCKATQPAAKICFLLVAVSAEEVTVFEIFGFAQAIWSLELSLTNCQQKQAPFPTR